MSGFRKYDFTVTFTGKYGHVYLIIYAVVAVGETPPRCKNRVGSYIIIMVNVYTHTHNTHTHTKCINV